MSSRVPPEEVFGRQNAEAEDMKRGIDDALRLGGDQYADLARRIEDIEELQADMATTIAAIPVARNGQTVTSGFTPTTSWQTVATLVIPRPAGKSTVNVTAWGFNNIDWNSPSGASWPALQGRVIIDGSVGPTTGIHGQISSGSGISAKQSGMSMHAVSYTTVANITVEVQLIIAAWVVGSGSGMVWNATSAQIAAAANFTT